MRKDAPLRTAHRHQWDTDPQKLKRTCLTQVHMSVCTLESIQWHHSLVSKSTKIKVQKCRPTCSVSRLPSAPRKQCGLQAADARHEFIRQHWRHTDIYTHLQTPALHCLQRRCEAAPTARRLAGWIRRHAYLHLIGSTEPCAVQELNVQYLAFQQNALDAFDNVHTVNEMIIH